MMGTERRVGFSSARPGDICAAPDIETASVAYSRRFAGPAGAFLLKTQASLAKAMLVPYAGQSVLEVGGGHGQLLETYRSLDMDVTVHGSDLRCFERIQQEGFIGKLAVGDIGALPFKDKSFDVVVAVRLLAHLSDWRAAIEEMSRLARNAVVVDYPSLYSINALAPTFFGAKRGVEMNTRGYTVFAGREIRQAFAAAGLGQVAQAKQFFLPMVLHRMLGGRKAGALAEFLFRRVGLTRICGSPVLLRAERHVDARVSIRTGKRLEGTR
jgi:SAM-dependent methyltransferase